MCRSLAGRRPAAAARARGGAVSGKNPTDVLFSGLPDDLRKALLLTFAEEFSFPARAARSVSRKKNAAGSRRRGEETLARVW